MTFNEYLQHILSISYYPVSFSGDQPAVLNRWLVTSLQREKCDLSNIEPSLNQNSRLILRTEVTSLPKPELESNWRYYISENKDSFNKPSSPETMFSTDEDKVIYALCGVYCEAQQDSLLFLGSVVPARVWINGRNVFSSNIGHLVRPHLFVFPLQKGINTILIEKQFFAEYTALNIGSQHFLFTLKPCRYLMNNKLNHFFDKELFSDLKQSYTLVPEKTFYHPGEKIRLLVYPGWFTGADDKIKLHISNGLGEPIQDIDAQTSVPVELDLPGEITGLLRIKAESIANSRKASDVYIFSGDFAQAREQLILQATQRRDLNPEVLNSFKYLTDIPTPKSPCIKGAPEIIPNRLMYSILEKYAEFERYLNRPDATGTVAIFDVFPTNATCFKLSEIDDGFIAYNIFLPKGFNPRKHYPLWVSFQFGYGVGKYPIIQRYARKSHFSEAIILNMCGRGELNNDFIHELGTVEIIREVIHKYNIDPNRVYLVGSCMATLKALNLALRFPDLFAAVAGVNGTFRLDIENPDFDYLKNLDNTTVHQLCEIDDFRFNGLRVLDAIQHVKENKAWPFYNYSHDDFDEVMNSGKLLRTVIRAKKRQYPREVDFSSCEPVYNKSHWLQILHMEDLNRKATVKAEIKSATQIQIQTANVRALGIVLNRRLMKLANSIELTVNHRPQRIRLAPFSKIIVNIANADNGASNVSVIDQMSVVPLNLAGFINEYHGIHVNPKLLGIKELYCSKCFILKPNPIPPEQKGFLAKLYYYLQNPLKERMRVYQFPVLFENEATPEKLSAGNFITVINLGNLTLEFHEQLLKQAGFQLGTAKVSYQGRELTGDFFGLIKIQNPYNSGKLGLLVLYQGRQAENELLNAFNGFDYNPLFYNDVIIYCNNEYQTFRIQRDSVATNLLDEASDEAGFINASIAVK